jgi:hypothetical protein
MAFTFANAKRGAQLLQRATRAHNLLCSITATKHKCAMEVDLTFSYKGSELPAIANTGLHYWRVVLMSILGSSLEA